MKHLGMTSKQNGLEACHLFRQLQPFMRIAVHEALDSSNQRDASGDPRLEAAVAIAFAYVQKARWELQSLACGSEAIGPLLPGATAFCKSACRKGY